MTILSKRWRIFTEWNHNKNEILIADTEGKKGFLIDVKDKKLLEHDFAASEPMFEDNVKLLKMRTEYLHFGSIVEEDDLASVFDSEDLFDIEKDAMQRCLI